MWLLDVNILLYAHKEELPQHETCAAWLEQVVAGERPFAVTDFVLSGFLRIATNARLFEPPSTFEVALAFTDALKEQPNCLVLAPGARHWSIFTDLCRRTQATGNLVPDAYLAALAIETGSELVSADRDFKRFPGLRWHNPLA